ncbi:hypothetical protein JCM1840_005183 [Sporobolomyces johnsonii]
MATSSAHPPTTAQAAPAAPTSPLPTSASSSLVHLPSLAIQCAMPPPGTAESNSTRLNALRTRSDGDEGHPSCSSRPLPLHLTHSAQAAGAAPPSHLLGGLLDAPEPRQEDASRGPS